MPLGPSYVLKVVKLLVRQVVKLFVGQVGNLRRIVNPPVSVRHGGAA